MQAFEWTEEDANPPSAQVVTQSQAGLRLDQEEEGSGDDVENTRTAGLDVDSARVGIGWGGALAYVITLFSRINGIRPHTQLIENCTHLIRDANRNRRWRCSGYYHKTTSDCS